MHQFIFDYDTQFSKGTLWIRIKALTKEEALSEFWHLVPGCTEIRKITKDYSKMNTNRLTKQEKKQAASLRKQRKGKRNLWVSTDSCWQSEEN